MDFFENSSFNLNQSVSTGTNGAGKAGGDVDRHNNLVHCTLSQIAKHTVPDDNLVLFNQKIKTVSIIGFVESIEEFTTRNVYTIRDFSIDVPLEVQLWKNDPSEVTYQATPAVVDKTYIRVIGQARYDEKRPFIIAFHILPIQDPLEVEEHIMEAFADSIILEKKNNSSGLKSSSAMDIDTENTSSNLPLGLSGFNDIQKMIMNIIKKYGDPLISPHGINRSDIKQHLSAINGATIDQQIDFLTQEGHIFSTIDDDSFQSADQ